MLDIDYDDLKQEKRDIADREREMERAALRTLQHHPWRHATRLFFAGIGFRIRPDEEAAPQTHNEEPATA